MALLTVAKLKEHVTTSLGNDALQRLLDAAELAITSRYGAIGTVTDVRVGGTGLIQLSRRASSITTVAEVFTLDPGEPADLRSLVLAGDIWFEAIELEPDDYALDGSGFWLQRLADGTNPADTWGRGVRATYPAFDDTAERIRVQLDLVRLDLSFKPGLTGETIGTWSEQFGAAGDYEAQREEILRSLGPRSWRFA